MMLVVMVAVVMVVVGVFLVTGLMGAPYVPTLKRDLKTAFSKELYLLSKKDLLIDLGAGDGVVLEKAASQGARAVGIEVNPILAMIIRWRFRKSTLVSVRCRNFYRVKFPAETTVVYAFAVGPHIEAIYRKVKREAERIGHPIYFISNAFDLKEIRPVKKAGPFFLYKVG